MAHLNWCTPSRGKRGFMDEQTEVLNGSAAEEKGISPGQLGSILKRERAEAADRARKEADSYYSAEIERLKSSTERNDPIPEQLEEKIYNRLLQQQKEREQELIRQYHEDADRQKVEKAAQSFLSKISPVKDTLFKDDLPMVMEEISKFRPVVELLEGFEDTAEIVRELVDNPTRLESINNLALKSENLALREIKKLSNSIARNNKALDENISTQPPLSRLKSSQVGGDGGSMSYEDYKNADWLRG